MEVLGLLRDDILLERYRYPPGRAVVLPSHAHEEYQFNVNLDLVAGIHYRGAFHVIPPDTLTVTMPGEVHAPRDPEDRPVECEHLTVYIHPELVREAAEMTGLPSFPDLMMQDSGLVRRFADMHRVLSGPAPRLGQDVLLLELLADLAARYAGAAARPLPMAHHAVQRTRDYLHDNVFTNVTLAELTQVSGLSRYHLTRLFRATVGMPPHSYQLQARLEYAKRRLLAGEPVSEVAQRTGFFDLSHFSRHFRRHVGVPPGAYARSHSKIVQDTGPACA